MKTSTAQEADEDDRPIIGLLGAGLTDKYTQNYVKFLESAGAKVELIPVYNAFTDDHLNSILNSVNGILLPGGDADLTNSPYVNMGKRLFNMALRQNMYGDYFPVFGICLGFQAFFSLVDGSSTFLEKFNSENITLPMKLYPGFRNGRMFKHLPKSLENAIQKKKLNAHFHEDGVSPSVFWKSSNISSFYRLLGTSKGRDNRTFIAAIEGE